MLFGFCSSFTMEVLLLYTEFLDEFVEMSGNARTWHWIYGFHPSFLEKLCLCHSILICTVSCYCSHGCVCKPCQWFSIFKCRSICYFSAPRLVMPNNSFVSNNWKEMTIFFHSFLLLHWLFHFLDAQVPHQVPFCCMQCSEDLFFFLEQHDSLSIMPTLQRASRFLFELRDSCSLK